MAMETGTEGEEMPSGTWPDPSAVISIADAIAMRALVPLAALLLAGCSGQEAACERAVETALGDPKFYRTIDIKEIGETGKALELYKVNFAYLNDSIVEGTMICSYDNNNIQASAHNIISSLPDNFPDSSHFLRIII